MNLLSRINEAMMTRVHLGSHRASQPALVEGIEVGWGTLGRRGATAAQGRPLREKVVAALGELAREDPRSLRRLRRKVERIMVGLSVNESAPINFFRPLRMIILDPRWVGKETTEPLDIASMLVLMLSVAYFGDPARARASAKPDWWGRVTRLGLRLMRQFQRRVGGDTTFVDGQLEHGWETRSNSERAQDQISVLRRLPIPQWLLKFLERRYRDRARRQDLH